MIFDDDDYLSVRNGTPQGKSTENRMLQAMGGQDTIKKRFQTNIDGSVVMAHTRGFGTQPEFIVYQPELIASVCMLGMDSGVIDIASAGAVMDANSNDPGKLLYTQYVNDYIIANTPPTLTTPIVDVINPPETLGVPQTVGSNAKSFVTGSYSKKRIAVLCPPSVFTGKTRLYVQAMYGKHEAVSTISLAPTVGSLTPSIILSNGFEITTSCGVYLDPVTANHYLIKVTSTDVEIYQMFATTCAEKLRVKLLDVAISVNNKERIEAYILANSLPNIGSLVSLNYSTGFNINQFGYGWHWNWSGTACDIVEVTNDGASNHSTHRRITMSHTPFPEMVWTQTPSVIEGPTTWNNNKHVSVICYPVWDHSGFQKIGKVATPTGNSPYYAFYNKDTLKVARFSASTTTNSKSRTRSPSYYNPGLGVTQGTDALTVIQNEGWTGQTISLTCGGVSISYQSGSRGDLTYGHTSPTPTNPSVSTLTWNRTSVPMNSVTSYDLPNGKSSPIGPLSNTTDEYEPSVNWYVGAEGFEGGTNPTPVVTITGIDGWYTYNTTGFGGWPSSLTHWDGTISRLTTTAFISAPPFYDAEALLSFGGQTTISTEEGTKIDKICHGFFKASGIGPPSAHPLSAPYVQEIMGSDFGDNVSTYSYSNDPVVSSSSTTLIECNAGTLAATIPNGNPFFNVANSIVPEPLGSYASAHGSSVFSEDLTIDIGNAPASLTGIPFTYAGWA